MREETTIATDKRNLGTLPAAECGCSIFAASLRLRHCGYGGSGEG